MEAPMKTKTDVLYYHRVYEKQCDINLLCVSPKMFEQQMKYLKKNFNILRFEEDWTKSDRDSVVITFDDGYLDNLTFALSVLEQLQNPAGNTGTAPVAPGYLQLSQPHLQPMAFTHSIYF